METTLHKDGGGLGFSIAGGKGSLPYKGNDESVYISKLTPGGAAEKNGQIEVGDKILMVSILYVDTNEIMSSVCHYVSIFVFLVYRLMV